MNRFLFASVFWKMFFDQVENEAADFELDVLVFFAVAVCKHMKTEDRGGNVCRKSLPPVLESGETQKKDEENHGEDSGKTGICVEF